MKTYATMPKHTPDFFLHSGDTIYADGPLKDEVDLTDGTQVGQQGPDRREAQGGRDARRIPRPVEVQLMDAHRARAQRRLPTFFQWDDHEVVNNWSARRTCPRTTATPRSRCRCCARAARAFHEMTPIRYTPAEPGRVYRKIAYGPLLDVFFLDMRSYRGANGPSMEDDADAASPASSARSRSSG